MLKLFKKNVPKLLKKNCKMLKSDSVEKNPEVLCSGISCMVFQDFNPPPLFYI